MVAHTLTFTDPTNVTDAGVHRGWGGNTTDIAGLTDAGLNYGHSTTITDVVGITDAGSAFNVAETLTDSAGLRDTVVLAEAGLFSLTFTDSAGLLDTPQIVGGSALPQAPGTGPEGQLPGMPTLIVEVGFDVAPDVTALFHLDDPVLGLMDTSVMAGAENWSDVSEFLRGKPMTITRGVERSNTPTRVYSAGLFTCILRNDDRRFDPTNLDGPYVAAGVTQVEPMRAVRVRAVWLDQEYHLWRGFADTWNGSYLGPQYAETTLQATDGFKVLASHDRVEQEIPVGSGELTGARVARVLDNVAWPTTLRLLDAGTVPLVATQLGGTALGEAQRVSETEGGDLFMDAEGNVVFRDRAAIAVSPSSNTSQATFGDSAALTATGAELRYADVNLAYDAETLVNIAQIGREGGTVQEARNEGSVQKYLPHAYSRTDLLMLNDNDALVYAQLVVYVLGLPAVRFTELVLRPQRDPARLWPQALGRRIGDRVTIVRRPPGGGAIQEDVMIRGIRHDTDGEQWTTTFSVSTPTTDDAFVMDHPSLGLLDTSSITF